MPNGVMSKYMGASGLIVNLEGLRRDMRANAFEYLARLEAGQAIVGDGSIAQVIAGNAVGYMMRIKDWYQADLLDPVKVQLLTDGLLVDPSVTLNTLNAFVVKLLAIAQAEQDAVVKNPADVQSVSAATLAALPFVPS